MTTRKRSQLQSYFAGLFDGEGSIGIYNHSGTFKCHAHIGMNDPTTLGILLKEYPEGTFGTQINQSGSTAFMVAFNHYKAYRFLSEIFPYLVIKWEQAKVALSFLSHRRQEASKRKNHGQCRRCERYVEICKRLKKSNANGVNSVDLIIRHGLREYRAKQEDVEQDAQFLLRLLEGVETRLSLPQDNKTTSAPEKEIVQVA